MTTKSSDLVPGEHLKFVGGFLEVSDTALPKVDRSKLSASTADAMKGCQARYAADKVLPRTEDPFGAAEVGTAAHDVLEDLMTLPPRERTIETAQEMTLALARRTWPDVDGKARNNERIRWQKAVWEKVDGLWKIEDPVEAEVVATEWKLDSVKVAGIPFIGYVDRTDRDEDGLLKVIDYKSGKGKGLDAEGRRKLQLYGDSQGDQIRLYKLAMEEVAGEEVGSGSLYYIGEGKEREVSMSPVEVGRVRGEFQHAWDELKASVAAGAFETKPSGLCGWCPLVSICPSAAMDGRTPRIEVPTADELGIEVVSGSGGPTHQVSDNNLHDLTDTLEEAMATYDPAEDFDPFDDFAEPVAPDDTDDGEPEVAEPEEIDLGGARTERTKAPASRKAPAGSGTRKRTAGKDAAPTTVREAPSYLFGENKAWEPRAGRLPNGNAYGAQGAFGLAELAISQLTAAGARLRVADITSLAKTFALVVADAQEALSGSRQPGDGLATRMRGALRSTLEDMPAPIGASAEEWQEWMERTTRRCITLGQVAHAVLTQTEDDEPYLPLSSDEIAA